MNFNSAEFLFYFPLVILGFWLLPHKARKYWVLAASYFFYMYWNPILILLLLLSTVIDYCCSLAIERWREQKKLARIFLLISVCMNLMISSIVSVALG